MNIKIALAAVVGLLIGAGIGFVIGGNLMTKPSPTFVASTSGQTCGNGDIFSTQNASVEGTITYIDSEKLTVQNAISGFPGTFPIMKDARVITFPASSGNPSVSTNLKGLDTAKQVVVGLIFMDGQFKVATITVLPSSAPVQSSSSSAGTR